MGYQLRPVTRATLEDTPSVCQTCTFWQTREGRDVDKARWAERIEDGWGAWGTLYVGDGDRLLGSIQYGPATVFPRAIELPAGPPSADAVLITCAYLVDPSSPWVMQHVRAGRDRVVAEIELAGFRFTREEMLLRGNFYLRFRKP